MNLEAFAEGLQQLVVLGAGQLGDVAPQVPGLDDVVHAAAHELLKLGHVGRVGGVPHGQRGALVAGG